MHHEVVLLKWREIYHSVSQTSISYRQDREVVPYQYKQHHDSYFQHRHPENDQSYRNDHLGGKCTFFPLGTVGVVVRTISTGK